MLMWKIVILFAFVFAACDSSTDSGTRSQIIYRHDFGGKGSSPDFSGWSYAGPGDSLTFVNDSQRGWAISLEGGPFTSPGVAWFDFNQLDSGIYILSAMTRVIPFGTDVPPGKMTFDAGGKHSYVWCGPDTAWHRIEVRDTLTNSSSAAIHLYGGLPSLLKSRVLFTEIMLLKE